MRHILIATTAVVAIACAAVAVAGAMYDVKVHTEKDDKGRVIYMLTNYGGKSVKASVSYEKSCRSTTTRAKPIVRDYWLQPGQSERLRRVMAGSDCRHTFTVVSAEYR